MDNCLLRNSPRLGLYVQHRITMPRYEQAQIIDASSMETRGR